LGKFVPILPTNLRNPMKGPLPAPPRAASDRHMGFGDSILDKIRQNGYCPPPAVILEPSQNAAQNFRELAKWPETVIGSETRAKPILAAPQPAASCSATPPPDGSVRGRAVCIFFRPDDGRRKSIMRIEIAPRLRNP